MARRTRTLAIVLITTAVAACSRPEPAKSVAYYAEHPAEREARVALCKNDPGTLKDDPDCINASTAVIQKWGTSTLPPITFASGASAASR